jgi:hypothetical protein
VPVFINVRTVVSFSSSSFVCCFPPAPLPLQRSQTALLEHPPLQHPRSALDGETTSGGRERRRRWGNVKVKRKGREAATATARRKFVSLVARSRHSFFCAGFAARWYHRSEWQCTIRVGLSKRCRCSNSGAAPVPFRSRFLTPSLLTIVWLLRVQVTYIPHCHCLVHQSCLPPLLPLACNCC